MALLLSTGIAVTACPVPAAQMLTPNHLSQRQTMARPEMKKKIMKPVKNSWIYQP